MPTELPNATSYSSDLREIAQRLDAIASRPLATPIEWAAAGRASQNLCARAMRIRAKHNPNLPHPTAEYADDTELWSTHWLVGCLLLARSYPEKLGTEYEFAMPTLKDEKGDRHKKNKFSVKKQKLIYQCRFTYEASSDIEVAANIRDHAKACRVFADLIEQEEAKHADASAAVRKVNPSVEKAAVWIESHAGCTNEELANGIGLKAATVKSKRFSQALRNLGYQNAGRGKGGWYPPKVSKVAP